jgi:streptogramin lyase
MRSALLALLFTATACNGNSNTTTDAATDTPPPMDAMGDASDAGTDTGMPEGGVTCGTMRPDVSGIGMSEGLMIAPDGTIYYSQPAGVGRMRPGMAQEDTWVALPSTATTVWGIALDIPNQKLYVGSPSTHRIYTVDLTAATPTATMLPFAAGAPNGFTTGPDGAIYYTDFGGGQVYRIDPASGARAAVTTTMIPQANGIAFGPDGALYVDDYQDGTLVRLTVSGGHETGRSTVAHNLGSPDGLAFDAMGRIYVTDNVGGRLIRLNADGTNPTVLLMGMTAPANVEFGTGALSCTDIYVATGGVMMRYEMGTTNGADVPWHHFP